MKTQVALLRTTKMILFSLVALVLALTPLQSAGAEGLITATTPNRTIRFPAKALNFPNTFPTITQTATGLRWKSSFGIPAYLMVAKPNDWDGTSDVILNLYFQTTTSASGNVRFFIRPSSFNAGDTYGPASSLSGAPVAVSGINKINRQSLTIPASLFGSKSLWVITIQREGPAPDGTETYTDDVILLSVELGYSGQEPALKNVSMPANALNYLPDGTNLIQAPDGIDWSWNSSIGAYITLPKPADWDGATPVSLRLFFFSTTSTAGTVNFFIRPRSFDPGEQWHDVVGISAASASTSSSLQINTVTIPIPPESFGSKALWDITLQRSTTGTTYPDPVALMAFELSYTRKTAPGSEQGLTANSINYDAASPIITQSPYGVNWKWTSNNGAFIIIPRPTEWNGSSPVKVKFYFMTSVASAGNVDFFIRPRSYNPGDTFLVDALSVANAPAAVSLANQIQVQEISVPAAQIGGKDLWVITVQRTGTTPGGGETYTNDVRLMAVNIDFTSTIYLPFIKR